MIFLWIMIQIILLQPLLAWWNLRLIWLWKNQRLIWFMCRSSFLMMKAIALVTEQVTMTAICLILKGEPLVRFILARNMIFNQTTMIYLLRRSSHANKWVEEIPSNLSIVGAYDADFHLSIFLNGFQADPRLWASFKMGAMYGAFVQYSPLNLCRL